MSELVFATYLKELKNAWAEEIADPDLINLLYDAVSEPMELVNKENGTITTEKSAASKIMNRQKGGNALKVIRTNANKDKVRSSIEQYFEKNVVISFIIISFLYKKGSSTGEYCRLDISFLLGAVLLAGTISLLGKASEGNVLQHPGTTSRLQQVPLTRNRLRSLKGIRG